MALKQYTLFKKGISLTITLIFIFFACTSIAKPLTVVLDWFLNPDHAPLFVAKHYGFFKRAGIQVKLISPTDPNVTAKMIAANKADIAILYQPEMMLDVDAGLPLMRIGTLINHPLTCIITQKDIPTLFALKGKKIATTNGGVSSVMLATMLRQVHLSLSQVKPIVVNYDLSQAFLSHRVAAVTGVMRNFELIEMQQRGIPLHVFYPEQYGVPPYDELIYVTQVDQATKPRMALFLKAVRAATLYLRKHPKQCWRAFATAHPSMDNALERASWFASLAYFAKQPAYLDVKRYQRLTTFLYQHHLIRHHLAWQRYAR